jgi:23S rRNA pseudouridine1911/1915/1917 synthase
LAVRAEALAPQADLPVRVLFEDAGVVVVDKPPGLPSVALRAASRDTVANFLAARYGAGRDPGDLECGLVQRLDTETSGAMIAALNEAARLDLRRQLRDRSVEKVYLAVVRGDCAAPGSLAEPIGQPPRRKRRVAVRRQLPSAARSRARPAETHYRPLERFGTATLLEVRIATGVRHQIRVHLASIGHPLLGDHLYGRGGTNAIAVPRLLLHAWRVRFRHPTTRRWITVRAPLPPDFRLVASRLRRAAQR